MFFYLLLSKSLVGYNKCVTCLFLFLNIRFKQKTYFFDSCGSPSFLSHELKASFCVCVSVPRTPIQGISSLTCTRTCWPKPSSPRKPRKGDIFILILLFFPLSIFKHAFNERIFLFSFPSVCSPSWDARGTLAPPLLRLPPRQQRKKALPRGQVPTLQLARISDPGQKKRTQKREKDSVTLLSVVWVFSLKSNRASRTPQQHH